MSNSKGPEDESYLMDRHHAETKRLDEQHELFRRANGGKLLHPAIPAPKVVMDIAAGTGIWLRDIGTQFPDAKLVGSDVSDAQFPKPPSAQVTLIKHSALDAFPEEHLSRYDLVHQRLLIMAFTKSQWQDELNNICTLIRPGGWIQIVEADMFAYEGEASYESVQVFLKIMTEVETAFNKEFRFCSNYRPYFEAAGLTNIQESSFDYLYGASASEDIAEATVQSLRGAAEPIFRFCVRTGVAKEWIPDDESVDAFLKGLLEDVRTKGARWKMCIVAAQRPE